MFAWTRNVLVRAWHHLNLGCQKIEKKHQITAGYSLWEKARPLRKPLGHLCVTEALFVHNSSIIQFNALKIYLKSKSCPKGFRSMNDTLSDGHTNSSFPTALLAYCLTILNVSSGLLINAEYLIYRGCFIIAFAIWAIKNRRKNLTEMCLTSWQDSTERSVREIKRWRFKHLLEEAGTTPIINLAGHWQLYPLPLKHQIYHFSELDMANFALVEVYVCDSF